MQAEIVPAPTLSPEALARAREVLPGADAYALQAEWLDVWERRGRAVLRNPDSAFLGWVRKRG